MTAEIAGAGGGADERIGSERNQSTVPRAYMNHYRYKTMSCMR